MVFQENQKKTREKCLGQYGLSALTVVSQQRVISLDNAPCFIFRIRGPPGRKNGCITLGERKLFSLVKEENVLCFARRNE